MTVFIYADGDTDLGPWLMNLPSGKRMELAWMLADPRNAKDKDNASKIIMDWMEDNGAERSWWLLLVFCVDKEIPFKMWDLTVTLTVLI